MKRRWDGQSDSHGEKSWAAVGSVLCAWRPPGQDGAPNYLCVARANSRQLVALSAAGVCVLDGRMPGRVACAVVDRTSWTVHASTDQGRSYVCVPGQPPSESTERTCCGCPAMVYVDREGSISTLDLSPGPLRISWPYTVGGAPLDVHRGPVFERGWDVYTHSTADGAVIASVPSGPDTCGGSILTPFTASARVVPGLFVTGVEACHVAAAYSADDGCMLVGIASQVYTGVVVTCVRLCNERGVQIIGRALITGELPDSVPGHSCVAMDMLACHVLVAHASPPRLAVVRVDVPRMDGDRFHSYYSAVVRVPGTRQVADTARILRVAGGGHAVVTHDTDGAVSAWDVRGSAWVSVPPSEHEVPSDFALPRFSRATPCALHPFVYYTMQTLPLHKAKFPRCAGQSPSAHTLQADPRTVFDWPDDRGECQGSGELVPVEFLPPACASPVPLHRPKGVRGDDGAYHAWYVGGGKNVGRHVLIGEWVDGRGQTIWCAWNLSHARKSLLLCDPKPMVPKDRVPKLPRLCMDLDAQQHRLFFSSVVGNGRSKEVDEDKEEDDASCLRTPSNELHRMRADVELHMYGNTATWLDPDNRTVLARVVNHDCGDAFLRSFVGADCAVLLMASGRMAMVLLSREGPCTLSVLGHAPCHARDVSGACSVPSRGLLLLQRKGADPRWFAFGCARRKTGYRGERTDTK